MQRIFNLKYIRQLSILIGLIFFVLGSSAQAALFLSFDGVEGDAKDVEHEGEIVIGTVNWGVSVNASAPTSGSGREVSKPNFQDLSWTQTQDSSFPVLFERITNGEVIKNAAVSFVTNSDGKPLTYFEMKFGDVVLTSLSLSAGSDDLPSVSGSFAYGLIELIYTPFNEKGAAQTPVSASYNLVESKGELAALTDLFGRGLAGPEFSPVPIPGAVFLFGSAVLGLAGTRRAKA